jgi:hypothetical protein
VPTRGVDHRTASLWEVRVSIAEDLADPREGAVITELKAANGRLMRDLERAKANREDLVQAVYRAVHDAADAIGYEPVPRPLPDRRKRDEETAVVLFSDLQLGQRTATYDTDIARARVERYADKIDRLVDLHRASTPVRRCRVYFLGDLIENELTFPSQPWQVDSSLYAQVALNGPQILGDFLRRMLATFDTVDVVSVPGNHGEPGGLSRKQANPETNFDRMLSTILRHIFEAAGEKRITFTIPDGFGRASWYAVDTIGEVGFLLWHGHQARRMSNASHLPFYKLVMGWRSGAIPEPFSISVCGHHHVPTMLQINTVTHFINGTFASDSDYAIERLASNSGPAQWLLFTNGKRLTAQYLVDIS